MVKAHEHYAHHYGVQGENEVLADGEKHFDKSQDASRFL